MMRGGNATIGTWLQFPSADVAEVMGASGYDWVAVDMEHGAFTRAILPIKSIKFIPPPYPQKSPRLRRATG